MAVSKKKKGSCCAASKFLLYYTTQVAFFQAMKLDFLFPVGAFAQLCLQLLVPGGVFTTLEGSSV